MESRSLESTAKSIKRGYSRLLFSALLLTLLFSFIGVASAKVEEVERVYELPSSANSFSFPESSFQDLIHTEKHHEKNLEVCASLQISRGTEHY